MNLTHTEATTRTNSLSLSSYHIHVDLTQARTAETFPVRTTVEFTTTAPQTFLDYLGKEVHSVQVNGERVDAPFNNGRIHLTDLPTNAPVTVTVESSSFYSRTGQGLHRFTDTADGETYLYSHFEPSDARRVYPCFDQPDLKASFGISLDVPEGWVALTNGTDKPMSTYLTALAAGPYVCKKDSWNDIELGAWARKSMTEYVDDEILEITKQGLEFFHEAYDFPYPWGKYDSIFVPEYNLGAMENPGLVTFTEKYLFRSQATRAQHAARANTILHEMSHMWFGDLVTPQWWDDLWLKESFAEFMGADASAHATRYTEAWVNFAGNRKNWAYMQDQLPTTHPIKAEIPDVDAARQNFDGITYAKGAAVLKQLVHFVGRENFYAGARDYFKAHQFGSATFADLLDCLSAHTDRDVHGWANQWLKTTGPDTLQVVDSQILPTRLPHRIDVTVFDADLQPTTVDVDVPAAVPAGELVVPNDNDHTYAKVVFDERSLDTIRERLSALPDITRAVIWTGLWNQVRDAELDPRTYIDIVLRHVRGENITIATQVLANAQFAVSHYVDIPDFAERVWALVDAAEPGTDEHLVLLRAAIAAGGVDRLKAYETEDTELRWAILRRLAAHGEEVDAAAELERDNTLTGKAEYLGATLTAPTMENKDKIFTEITTPGKYSNAEVDSLVQAYNAPGSQELRAHLTERFFAALPTIWEQHPIEMANRIIRGLYPDDDRSVDAEGALRRILLEEQDHVRRTQKIRAAVK